MNNLRYYLRLIHIIYVFWKHDLISYTGKLLYKNAKIAKALEELGPAFIKLGQFLSTRPDLVGLELAESLGYLRDRLSSFSFKEVEEIITSEFHLKLKELYQEFDKEPVAAASIAQVHKAVTIDGKKVAVKVRRPNIENILNREIEFFYFLARIFEKKFPKYQRLKPLEVVKKLEESFHFELDLSFEAAAAAEMALKNKLEYVVIPKVDWLRTSEKIFTMEWVDAVSIYERDKLVNTKQDLTQLATNFAMMFFNQAFVNGFFHADLHQGNIMVNDKGQIILLDFGIMGRLDYNNRLYVAKILYGFLKRDYDYIAKVHQEAEYINKDCSLQLFSQSCRAIGEPIMILDPSQVSIAKLLSRLFKITEDFQMETQPQLLLLQKSMIMVEGIGKILCPESNLWHLAAPSIEQWAEENLSFEAKAIKSVKKLIYEFIDKLSQEL